MDLVMCEAHGPQTFNDGTIKCPRCADAQLERDAMWIERNLGDVPVETERRRWTVAYGVPTESLGRDP